jgi:hypothetical protein
MGVVIAYVVSGSGGSPTVVTPVDTVTHTAGSPIVFAKGGQSRSHPMVRPPMSPLPASKR